MKDTYESPLNSRYAGKEMQQLFSPDKNSALGGGFGSLWRKVKKNWGFRLQKSRSQS